MRNLLIRLTLGLPICLPLPALAEEPGSGLSLWLGTVGEFIQSGIEPPRTVEDLLRQEEEERVARRAAALPPPPLPEAVPPLDPLPDMDPGMGPEPGPEPEFEPAALPQPTPRPQMAAPQPIIAPSSPLPRPQTSSQSAPAVLPSFPPALPISPAERIAGTATIDQALKLGGPADLYTHPIRRPAAAEQ